MYISYCNKWVINFHNFKSIPSVEVGGLTYNYGGPPVLQDVNLNLEKGSRCLLIGGYLYKIIQFFKK